ncbi:hypothetical protein [Paraburkholderia phenoliruptrix]|uniref:hypothetical protein n=1 Tax=Paraburkholderia phenoliruptrix TaxID=252970 RepID=UPI002869A887|nr:hypothetical protein [Paraburkholderia phenoliruptrix]WMY11812.1 hypothetical protein P3F88_20590 [Paraburkholderia phenoliruptrix]
MLNELTRLTYLSFYIWEAGIGDFEVEVYEAAEGALNRAVEQAEQSGIWQLLPSDCQAIERMLAAYDEQIAATSAKTYLQAAIRLDRVLARSDPVSPLARKGNADRSDVRAEEQSCANDATSLEE